MKKMTDGWALLFRLALCAGLLAITLCGFSRQALALPRGESVVNGQVTFERSQNRLVINQATGKAIVNYDGFDIGGSERVDFHQPGSAAAILNRVVGGSRSTIAGAMNANGRVFLINPAGIIFSPSAQVNVGALVASALNMSDSDFLNERMRFSGGGGAVVNQGSLSGGSVFLVGGVAQNSGSISAREVVMAAGRRSVEIDRAADGRIFLYLDGELHSEDGEPISNPTRTTATSRQSADVLSEVQSKPTAESDRQVHMTRTEEAALDRETFEYVAYEVPKREPDGTRFRLYSGSSIANSDNPITVGTPTPVEQSTYLSPDTIRNMDVASAEQSSASVRTELSAPTAPALEQPLGTVINNGLIDASGEQGGIVMLKGIRVGQFGTIRADGVEGDGGDIRIEAVEMVVLGGDSVTTANAGRNGNGGNIVIMGRNTRIGSGALIEARGGSESGDGGFVETSGHDFFQIDVSPDVSAGRGKGGTWLIDPYNITVVASNTLVNINTNSPFNLVSIGDSAFVGVSNIINLLQSGGAVIIRTGDGGAQAGDINFNAALDYNGLGPGSILILQAHNNLNINEPIYDSNTADNDALNLDVGTGNDFNINDEISLRNGNMIANVGNSVNINANVSSDRTILMLSSNGVIGANGNAMVSADILILLAERGIGVDENSYPIRTIHTDANRIIFVTQQGGVRIVDRDDVSMFGSGAGNMLLQSTGGVLTVTSGNISLGGVNFSGGIHNNGGEFTIDMRARSIRLAGYVTNVFNANSAIKMEAENGDIRQTAGNINSDILIVHAATDIGTASAGLTTHVNRVEFDAGRDLFLHELDDVSISGQAGRNINIRTLRDLIVPTGTNGIFSNGGHISLVANRNVRLEGDVVATNMGDIAIWADSDRDMDGDILQTTGDIVTDRGNIFLAADQYYQASPSIVTSMAGSIYLYTDHDVRIEGCGLHGLNQLIESGGNIYLGNVTNTAQNLIRYQAQGFITGQGIDSTQTVIAAPNMVLFTSNNVMQDFTYLYITSLIQVAGFTNMARGDFLQRVNFTNFVNKPVDPLFVPSNVPPAGYAVAMPVPQNLVITEITETETIRVIKPSAGQQEPETRITVQSSRFSIDEEGRITFAEARDARRFHAVEAFLREAPELKSKQGVFGDPFFIHEFMGISDPIAMGLVQFILTGDSKVMADPNLPPEASRDIIVGGLHPATTINYYKK